MITEAMFEYDKDWFKKRALSSLKKISPHTWDYSDSLLLYISSSSSEAYRSIQEDDGPYFKLVTSPEREYLAAVAKNIADALPDKFEYIDLGPGTEHKEQFFFDEFKKLNKEFIYRPVDISQYFLEMAQNHAVRQGIQSVPIQSSFEELPVKLGGGRIPRFVSLGLTFSNYSPQSILSLLTEIAGVNGFILINAQMRDRIDMKELEKVYRQVSMDMADDKLELFGLKRGVDVTAPEINGDIRAWCTILDPKDELKKLGVEEGDKLLVFQSLRYTKETLEKELRESGGQYELFDIGSSFIGALIKT